jgi:hypothetical protein
MKNIFAFGDSFIDTTLSDDCWLKIFKNKYTEYNVNSYGQTCSGLNYSLVKFWEVYSKNQIKDDDIIIFNLSHPERMYVYDQPEPTLAFYSRFDDRWDYPVVKQNYEWCKKNFDQINWAMLNIFAPEINFEILKVPSFLKVWSENNKTNKVLVFRAFDDYYSSYLDMIKSTSNFYNITEKSLYSISTLECGFDSKSTQDESLYISKNGDCNRPNHLCPLNNYVFADLVYNVITKQDPTEFKWDMFYKHILRAYKW